MKKRKRVLELLGVLLLALLIPVSAWAQVAEAKPDDVGPSIGTINNADYRYFDGCGDPQIWPRGRGEYGGKGTFYVLPGSNLGIIMSLNGAITVLQPVENSSPKRLKRGLKFSKSYEGSGFSVQLDYTVVGNPVIYGDGVSATFDVTITASDEGGANSTVKAVSKTGC